MLFLFVLEYPAQHFALALRLLAVSQQKLALLFVEEDVEDARADLQGPSILQYSDFDLVTLDERAEVSWVLEEGKNDLPTLFECAISGNISVGVVVYQLGLLLLRLMAAVFYVFAVLFYEDVVVFLNWLFIICCNNFLLLWFIGR